MSDTFKWCSLIGCSSSSGRSLTCDQTLAGISGGERVDAVWRVWDLVSSVLDGDGVASRHVRYIGNRVCPVPIVPDVRLLGFPLWILDTGTGSEQQVEA